MSKAFKCDRCGELIEGDADLRIKTNKLIVVINYMPEVINDVSWYTHGLCKKCADGLIKFWRGKE
jgi:hypothetical protein